MRRLSAGETPAAVISMVFLRHHGDLVRLALLLVGDQPTAEDVVQDVYLSVQQRWRKLPLTESELPYIRAAVLNRSTCPRRR